MPRHPMPLIEEDDIKAVEALPAVVSDLHDSTLNALHADMTFSYYNCCVRYALKEFYHMMMKEFARRDAIRNLRRK